MDQCMLASVCRKMSILMTVVKGGASCACHKGRDRKPTVLII